MGKRTVRATVGPKTLVNVDRYFDNTLEGILTELLANARRAGASRVSVDLDVHAGEVVVSDDGRGIASDGAATLLAFGGSGNGEVVEADEAPAGMGFFSLARRGAVVASRDWEMEVPPEAFAGTVGATLRDGLPARVGTSVRFPEPTLGRPDLALRVVQAAADAARAMPFTCLVMGEVVRRVTPLDRLRDAVELARGRGMWAEVAEAIVDDCQVVVARIEATNEVALGIGLADEDGPLSTLVHADVFGQVLRLDPAWLWARSGGRHLAEVEGAVALSVGGRWRGARPTTIVVLHALGSRALVPRLPDRRGLVANDGIAAVSQAVRETSARLAARAPRNAAGAALREVVPGLAVPPRQFVAREPAAGSGRGAHSPVVVEDGGAPAARLPEGLIAIVDPRPEVEALLVRAREMSRASSALRQVVATTPIEDVAGFGTDVVRSVEVEVDGEWAALMVGYGTMVLDAADVAGEVAFGLAGDGRADGPAYEVGRLRVRIRTRDGRTVVGVVDHVTYGSHDAPLLHTKGVDAQAAARSRSWLHLVDTGDAEGAAEAGRQVEEGIVAAADGVEGLLAHQVAKLLLAAPENEARKLEARVVEGGSWVVTVTRSDGEVLLVRTETF